MLQFLRTFATVFPLPQFSVFMIRSILFLLLLVMLPTLVLPQSGPTGIIQGRIMEAQSKIPIEYANVALTDTVTKKLVAGAVTDSTGAFRLAKIPYGIYFLNCSFIGYRKQQSKPILIVRYSRTV